MTVERSTSDGKFWTSVEGELSIGMGSLTWPASSWDEYQEITKAGNAADGHTRRAILVLGGSQSPTPAQRKAMAATCEQVFPNVKRMVILGDSVFLRGAFTAFGWLMRLTGGNETKMYKPSDIAEACVWLQEVASFDEKAAIATIKRLSLLSGYPADYFDKHKRVSSVA